MLSLEQLHDAPREGEALLEDERRSDANDISSW